MGLFRVVKKGFSFVGKGLSFGIKPKKWMGYDHVKGNARICSDLAQDMIDSVNRSGGEEVKRVQAQMTESELQARKKLALGLVAFYGAGWIGAIGYTFYLLFSRVMILQGIMSLIISFLVLSYLLRELMVYGQICARRDRLVLKELFYFIFKGFPK